MKYELEECIRNKVVPEIHFVALLKLKASARTISVESTLALNPWCFGAKVVYVHTPGIHPPQCKAIYDSLSVLPKLEKIKTLWVIHSTWQIIAPPSEFVPHSSKCPHVPKSLPRALRNIRHLREWSTALKVGAVRYSEIKCCKKGFKKHTQKTNHYWIICVACYNAQALFLPQLHSWISLCKSNVICT